MYFLRLVIRLVYWLLIFLGIVKFIKVSGIVRKKFAMGLMGAFCLLLVFVSGAPSAYSAIRAIVCISFFSIVFWVLFIYLHNTDFFKSTKHLNIAGMVLTGLCLILGMQMHIVLLKYPIENRYVTFESLEDVFYYTSSRGKIVNIIEGENSCMLIASSADDNRVIIPKNLNGYKIGGKVQRYSPAKQFEMYKNEDIDDYYVMGKFSTYEDEVTITDSQNTKFKIIINPRENSYQDGKELKSVKAYAFLEEVEDNYYIIVNGEKVVGYIMPDGEQVEVESLPEKYNYFAERNKIPGLGEK